MNQPGRGLALAIGGISYRQEWKQCGRNCGRCPHGPYWYAFWWSNGKTCSRYVGKSLPREVEILPEVQDQLWRQGEQTIPDRRQRPGPPPPPPPRKPISKTRALLVCGVIKGDTWKTAMARYHVRRRELVKAEGVSSIAVQELEEAWRLIESELP